MTNEDRNALRAWLDLLAASNAIKKSVDTTLRREFGVSISRFDVLSALDRAAPSGLRAGDLSQRLMVTEGNITQVTAPLIRDGLIRRTVNRDDKRVVNLKLTKKGSRLFAEMATEHRHWVSEAFSDFSEAQIISFRKLLGKLNLPLDSEETGKDAA